MSIPGIDPKLLADLMQHNLAGPVSVFDGSKNAPVGGVQESHLSYSSHMEQRATVNDAEDTENRPARCCSSHGTAIVFYQGPACPYCLTIDNLDFTTKDLAIAKDQLKRLGE